MEILETLSTKGKEQKVGFLLIGGHALNWYGISRQTGDIDLLIREGDQGIWKKIAEDLGYKLFHEHPNFLQYSPGQSGHWPLDFMIVDEPTFEGLMSDGKECDFDGIRVVIPGVEHLLALKLHALKQDQEFRGLKDLQDIVELLETSKIDVKDTMFKDLANQYGNKEIYDRIVEIFKKR